MPATVKAIWLHQWNHTDLASWDELRAKWPGPVYLKALDGVSWMREFDHHPYAVEGPSGRDDDPAWTWPEQNAIPWTVPRGTVGPAEDQVTIPLLSSAGRVILDLEPYDHFWQGTQAQLDQFVDSLQAANAGPIDMSIDYRRLPWPGQTVINRVSHILPQCYWTTFQRPWRPVLEEAYSALEALGHTVEYVLPGDADPDDLDAALTWLESANATASIWLWQSITPQNWEVIMAHSDDESPPAPAPELDALVNRLGYLQGDVADAIGNALDEHDRHLQDAARALQSARDALNTLRTEGR